MNEFQKKRLAYFIKAAKNNDWVRLGPGDDELLEELLAGYGWAEGQGMECVNLNSTNTKTQQT